MKFNYSAFLSPAPDTGEEIIIFRPEVPLRIYGSTESAVYMALVDTWADNTILPLSIAHDLGINTQKGKGPSATAFGGQQLTLSFADTQLEIGDGEQKVRWHARVQFFDSLDSGPETIVVGHQGFLDFFTAVFDGSQMTL